MHFCANPIEEGIAMLDWIGVDFWELQKVVCDLRALN